jgi:hypothetical protein
VVYPSTPPPPEPHPQVVYPSPHPQVVYPSTSPPIPPNHRISRGGPFKAVCRPPHFPRSRAAGSRPQYWTVPGALGCHRLPLGAIHQPYCTSLAMHVTAGGTCAIIHMTGEENCSCSSWQVRLSAMCAMANHRVTGHIACLLVHGRSQLHFANFNCPSRAQFTLHDKLHVLCIMTGHITCRRHSVMSHCMPCASWQVTLPAKCALCQF